MTMCYKIRRVFRELHKSVQVQLKLYYIYIYIYTMYVQLEQELKDIKEVTKGTLVSLH